MQGTGGIRSEVVLSLAIIMVTATALLAAFFFRTHAAQVERLQELVVRGLLAESSAPTFRVGSSSAGTEWWLIDAGGDATPHSENAGVIDALSLELAAEARRQRGSVLRKGAPWEPMRFAVPLEGSGDIAVARLPSVVSRGSLLALVLVDSAIFAVFGSYLLRRRVVAPLLELARAARVIGVSGPGGRVSVDGVDEVREVAGAFNEMSEALEQRSQALQRANDELRASNERLSHARAGLDRAERLAAVGRLAAGVAHEVGNPMAALLAFLELAERDHELGEATRSHLHRASEQGARVREILRQLLDFSRPPQARRRPVDLKKVAHQIESLLRAQKRYEGIEFEVRCADGVVAVESDESMISQILLNLVINAADAVCEKRGARVRLAIEPGRLRGTGSSPGGVSGGRIGADAIECHVEDNGEGIPEVDRERIFDPFFTTKAPGEGTGLGLANAQRLAEELGGGVDLACSEELGGADFVLRLPAELKSETGPADESSS